MRILHVEVGGSYGGSIRALEVYLAHCDRSRLLHDALFLYPTPGAERLAPWAGKVWTLYDQSPGRILTGIPGARQLLDRRPRRWDRFLSGAYEWAGLARSLRQVNQLRSVLRSGDYDVVHVNNTFSYQAPTLIAARSAGIPVMAHVRNPVRASVLSRHLMRLANCVVTVNRHFEEQLRGWGLPVPVRTCYDGVEVAAPDGRAASALRACLVPSEGILIGSAGRLDTQKGYEDLVRAARIVIDAHPTARFAIAGAGPLRARLESLIAELDLVDRFHLLGFREDVPNFLAALDLFVSSSLWEGLPLVLVEAMLLGKAVVATDVGGNSEMVIPGQTGDLVPPGKPDAMAAAVLASLRQKDMLARHAPEARRLAAALCDPHRSAQNFDEILQSVKP